MADKISKDGQVFFNDAEHKYTIKTGERLISVSQIIHKFAPKFDPTGVITRMYAKKHGKTVKQVLKEWQEITDIACTYGTAVHADLEHFILTGEILDGPYRKIVENFSKMNFDGKLFSEVLVHSIEHMVAGLVDVVELLPNKVINIWDFKTNKELKKFSKYKTKMLNEMSHLQDCNFNHYQLQLSLYAYLMELKGMTVGKLTVIYIRPDNHEIELHPITYMRDEVRQILSQSKQLL